MSITPLPTPPSISDASNFATRADAFLSALGQFVTEANALAATAWPKGYRYGGTLSNNAGTPNTKVDIAAGAYRDSGDAQNMAAFAAGTVDCGTVGANGLDAGSLANNTWYFFAAIMKADGTQAYLASTNPAFPSLPSGYIYKRRLRGAVKTDSSAHFLPFLMQDARVYYTAATQDFSSVTPPNTSFNAKALNTPLGIKTRPLSWADVSSTALCNWAVASGDQSPSGTYHPMAITTSGGDTMTFGLSDFFTDTSSQIKFLASSTSSSYSIFTRGFIDEGFFD